MDHPPPRPLGPTWRRKRPNPVPLVLLILLLFGIPLLLIPPALDAPTPTQSESRLNPREELDRTLAEQGVLPALPSLPAGGASSNLAPPVEVARDQLPSVEVAGIFAMAPVADAAAESVTAESDVSLSDDSQLDASSEDDPAAEDPDDANEDSESD